MSSGETYWAWYVTHSFLLESNKSPTADCTAVCVCVCLCAMIPVLSVESSSATCSMSAAHLLHNPHARPASFSLFYRFAPWREISFIPQHVESYWKGQLTHPPLKGKAYSGSLLTWGHRKSLSLTGWSVERIYSFLTPKSIGFIGKFIVFASIQSDSLLLDDFETARLFMNHNR